MAITDMRDLFLHELKDVYDAEQQLVKALPKMRDAATSQELKYAFDMHLEETKGHVERIKEVFELLSETPSAKTCDAMKGLLKESEHILKAKMDNHLRDAGIVMAAQKVEHYEISTYGSLIAIARELKYDVAADRLQENLNEEKMADDKLNSLAENEINPTAMA